MPLPSFNTSDRILAMLQSQWSTLLDPLLANAANKPVVLKNVVLIAGTTQVNHLLGRPLQGWQIIRQRAAASIYDTQDSNQHPDLTLSLVSSALVTVDLMVF